MHQLAEQWKNFGTSTIHKLTSQIIDYQEKLQNLEQRQLSLLEENESLKSIVDQFKSTNINDNAQLVCVIGENIVLSCFILLFILFRLDLKKMLPPKHHLINKNH